MVCRHSHVARPMHGTLVLQWPENEALQPKCVEPTSELQPLTAAHVPSVCLGDLPSDAANNTHHPRTSLSIIHYPLPTTHNAPHTHAALHTHAAQWALHHTHCTTHAASRALHNGHCITHTRCTTHAASRALHAAKRTTHATPHAARYKLHAAPAHQFPNCHL